MTRYISKVAVITICRQYVVAVRPFPRVTVLWNGDKNENDQIDVRGTYPAWVDSLNSGMGWPRPRQPWTSPPAWRGLWRIWAGVRNGVAGLRSRLLQQQGTRLSPCLRLSAGWLRSRLWIPARCCGTPCTARIYPATMVALSGCADRFLSLT